MAFVVTPLKALKDDPRGQGNKKSFLYQIDPLLIEEEEGFNLRDYTDPKVIAHIEAFCDAYTNGRYVPPMIVRTTDDGRIVPVEGHCRRRGVRLALARGAQIPLVNVIPFQGNDAERVEVMLRSEQGLKLEVLDIARGYLRLLRMGFDPASIAASQNKTVVRVEQLLKLAMANSDVHALVRNGQVSVEVAIEAVRDHGEKAGVVLAQTLESAQREGRQRVTKSVVHGPSVPRKTVNSVISHLEKAIARVPPELRARTEALRKVPEAERGVEMVEIDANVLLGLMQAAKEIAVVKAKHAAKAARREAAAK
jgi:ParB family transcriptional regulator, chromosome partitioning protein